MNEIDFDFDNPSQIFGPLVPDNALEFTALPKDFVNAEQVGFDLDSVTEPIEYGRMNETDAIESGYLVGAKADVPTPWLARAAVLGGVAFLSWTAMKVWTR